jgi:hypothetical protein
MSHPDFRVGGKIFASLGYPDDKHGMVKLTPEQQRTFQHKAPGVFQPCAGAWGKQARQALILPQRMSPWSARFSMLHRRISPRKTKNA